MRSHDELSPFLHGFGRADLSVRDVGWNKTQKALHKDLRAVVHVILLRRQLRQILLEIRNRRERFRKSARKVDVQDNQKTEKWWKNR